MLESLRITDYQIHKRKFVKFAPITVFVGDSGRGKSAIIRCLRWVTTNRPKGMDFLGRWGKAKYAAGKLKVDGQTVIRKRSKSKNLYKLNGRIQKAFGIDPPKPVTELVNVGPANFQKQVDPPYWFTEKPSEVSKRLNDIINLRKIDLSLERAAKHVRKVKASMTAVRDRLNSCSVEKRQSAWIVPVLTQVQEIQRLTKSSDKTRKKWLKLAQICRGVSEANGAVRRAQRGQKRVLAAASAARRAIAARQRFDGLTALVRGIEQQARLEALAVPSVSRLDRLRKRAQRSRERHRLLDSLVVGLTNVTWEIEECQRLAKPIRKRIEKIRKTRCPTCGQKMSKQSPLATATSRINHREAEENQQVRRGIPSKGKSSKKSFPS